MFSIRNLVAEAIKEHLDVEEVISSTIAEKVKETLDFFDFESLVESYISDAEIEKMVEEEIEREMEDMLDV